MPRAYAGDARKRERVTGPRAYVIAKRRVREGVKEEPSSRIAARSRGESTKCGVDSSGEAHEFKFPRAGTESSSCPCCPCAVQHSRNRALVSNPSDGVVSPLLLETNVLPDQNVCPNELEPLLSGVARVHCEIQNALLRGNYSLGVALSSPASSSAGASATSSTSPSGAFVATSVAYSAHAACASVSGVNSPYSREPM